jgi:poly(3-hydroxybutyrate) depolymerase
MHYLRNAFAAVVLLAPAFLTGVLGANSPGCGKTPTMKDGTYTAQVNGKARQYILKLPANYDNSHPYRLVFTLHALGGNAQQLATGSGAYYALPPLANNSAIFVSPNGLNSGWGNTGGEDILFIDAMLLAIEADLCVDQNLRFSCGFSYGGAMSYAISCARAEKFRAIGIFSGGTMSGCQGGKPSGPIATYQQHGTNDQVSTETPVVSNSDR